IIELGNINGVYREYAKTLGKSLQDLTEQERATARLLAIQEEGRKVLGAYANTYNTSGKAFDSFKDAMKSNIQILGKSLEPILGVVGNAFVQFANGIRGVL